MILKMIKKIKQTLIRYNMLDPGDRVVVGVSGGPDSVCLLSVLYEIKVEFHIELIVAHFDHALRPLEDDAETRFVESLAMTLDLPFVTKKSAPGLWPGNGPLEERARQARYCFLKKVGNSYAAQKIAVGHTLNDQAETVLMRLLRGSGVSGLSGILPCRQDQIIRPLIRVSRAEVTAYLEKKGLEYLTDPTNTDPCFLRNRIRHEILPELEKIQPRIVHRLGRTAEMMRRDNEWLEAESERWVNQHFRINRNREWCVPLSPFMQLSEGMKFRVIRHAVKKISGTLRRIGLRHIEAVNSMAESTKSQSRVDLPNGGVVKRTYDRLVFSNVKGEKIKPFCYSLEGPGTFELPEINATMRLEEIEAKDLPDTTESRWTAFLDADQINFPLILRNVRPGDRFIPLGMSGHRKVKDFFIDLKVPLEERARTPILTHEDKLLWICGFRVDQRFRVVPETEKIVKVVFEPEME